MFGAILSYFLYRDEDQFLSFFSSNHIKILILLGLLFTYFSLLIFRAENVYMWVFFRSIFGVFCAGFIGLLVVGFKGIAVFVLENKYLVYGGKLSYAIYLLHNFLPGMLIEIKKFELPVFIEFIIYFIVTILLSMLIHRFIEMPIRKWSKKLQIVNY
jgi:peptidoglycan/LPS O-acetylase OafA/YrhL